MLELDDATLIADLERLVDPSTRGDPMSPLRWTCKSTRQLAPALKEQGHEVSHPTVAALLHSLGYSLQVNRKTREGGSHPERNAQFELISRRVIAFQKSNQPVISVDTKKNCTFRKLISLNCRCCCPVRTYVNQPPGEVAGFHRITSPSVSTSCAKVLASCGKCREKGKPG